MIGSVTRVRRHTASGASAGTSQSDRSARALIDAAPKASESIVLEEL
jgi:hypothetical protein